MGATLGPSGWQVNYSENKTTPRIPVEEGHTSFFAGREFRTYYEFNLATGASVTFKVVVAVNIILEGFVVDLVGGSLKVESLTGGTEGGTFSTVLPIMARNSMTERPTPLYTPQVAISAGGTVSGATVLDVFRLQTSGQGAQAGSVGTAGDDGRGIGPGTYYIRLSASGTDNTVGVTRLRWEERP